MKRCSLGRMKRHQFSKSQKVVEEYFVIFSEDDVYKISRAKHFINSTYSSAYCTCGDRRYYEETTLLTKEDLL